MHIRDFVTYESILADVLKETDDEGMRIHSPGWYKSQIQQALEELAFDTFFDKGNVTIFDMPKSLYMIQPTGMFNIQEIYAFNCSCGAEPNDVGIVTSCCCATPVTAKIWWKQEFNNLPAGGTSYTASRKEYGSATHDGIMPQSFTGGSGRGSLLWWNIENGMWMFSASCAGYTRFKVKYTGLICKEGDVPFIPRFFRQAVKEWTCEKFFKIAKNNDRAHRVTWREYKAELDEDDTNSAWSKAIVRVAKMDNFEMKAMREFWGRPDY